MAAAFHFAAMLATQLICMSCGYFWHFEPHRYQTPATSPPIGNRSSAASSSYAASSAVEAACNTKEGVSGSCRSIQNCTYAIANFNRVQLTICAWRAHVPVVCCPRRPSPTPSPPTPPRPLRPFSIKPLRPLPVPLTSTLRPSPAPHASSLVAARPYGAVAQQHQYPRPADFSIQNENGTLTFKVGAPPGQDTSERNRTDPVCGVQSYQLAPTRRRRSPLRFRPNSKDPDQFHSTSSIVGGTEAALGSFPWMAAIFKTTKTIGSASRKTFLCGGSILDSRHVITAAHCFQKNDEASMFHVRLGDHDLSSDDDDRAPTKPEEVAVDKLVLHPSYQPPQIYHDLALLRLSRPLVLASGSSLPICLPKRTDENDTHPEATVAGWGSTQDGRPTTSVLHKVTLPVVSNEQCDAAYARVLGMSLYFPNGISDRLLCAGFQEGGKDACQGDSGGPLMVLDDDERWTLLGIVSVGRGCAEPGFPGLYTRVIHYLDWIRNQTDEA